MAALYRQNQAESCCLHNKHLSRAISGGSVFGQSYCLLLLYVTTTEYYFLALLYCMQWVTTRFIMFRALDDVQLKCLHDIDCNFRSLTVELGISMTLCHNVRFSKRAFELFDTNCSDFKV